MFRSSSIHACTVLPDLIPRGAGYNGIAEIDAVVSFLRQNDALARKIGENSKRFAHEHLNEEGRLCYVKVRQPGRRAAAWTGLQVARLWSAFETPDTTARC